MTIRLNKIYCKNKKFKKIKKLMNFVKNLNSILMRLKINNIGN